LDALKDFYADRDARAKQFEQLKAVAEDEASSREQQPLSMEAFTEDWNESQFWVRQAIRRLGLLFLLRSIRSSLT